MGRVERVPPFLDRSWWDSLHSAHPTSRPTLLLLLLLDGNGCAANNDREDLVSRVCKEELPCQRQGPYRCR